LEVYVARLALRGCLSLDDFLDFEAEQRRRIGHTLLKRDAALAQVVAEQERKQAELEAANRVLLQRTRTLISLQEIGQSLITSTDLKDLAARICRFLQDLCGADRAIVYYLHSGQDAEPLASAGWDPQRIPPRVDPAPVFAQIGPAVDDPEPAVYNLWPPGIPPRHADIEGAELRGGLYAPLIAQGKRLGFILCHTTRRPRFAPKEVSLLRTLAQQVALGIQRARLITDLRNKIIELEDAQAELAKKERLERDLELARQVQQSMLPHDFPEIAGFQIAARNQPARQVGGDFYDVILLDNDRFGVSIADVSDKGLPAALYMALTRSLLRAEARRGQSPLTVLNSVNRLLLELGDGKSFVTLFYGIIDRQDGRMVYARAGHERPYLLHDGAAEFLPGDGMPLGLFADDFHLTEEEVRLAPGDRLVLYTDGLCDVAAPSGALFGLERLSALLLSLTGQPLAGACEAIFQHLLSYQGEADQYDDMTLLALQYNPS
jgi:serine phosphatase RsbU (regulator of sigma subunit)